jgi:catechol 2,3-dioxygenase-like lactoylglutathione lyase family enzyme
LTATHPRVIRRLAGVVAGVPDPGATASFLNRGLGFTIREDAGRLQALCDGDYGDEQPQAALSLVEHGGLELVELEFDLEESVDLGLLSASVGDHGGAVANEEHGAIRFTDPNGVVVLCRRSEPVVPERLAPSGLRPRRLGHANLRVRDVEAAIRFWVRAMGMWLSEQIGGDLAFMRYGAEHHNLGVRGAAETTLHHLGFEIPGWDAYRAILDHLDAAGYGAEFGPGRHAVGRNMFTYLLEPSSGLRLELFCDMARVDHQENPEVAPIRWRAEDRMTRTLNVWGSAPPPASFLE